MQIKGKARGRRERFVAAAFPFDLHFVAAALPFDLHQGSKSVRRSASARDSRAEPARL
jgi:hypothetical protein